MMRPAEPGSSHVAPGRRAGRGVRALRGRRALRPLCARLRAALSVSTSGTPLEPPAQGEWGEAAWTGAPAGPWSRSWALGRARPESTWGRGTQGRWEGGPQAGQRSVVTQPCFQAPWAPGLTQGQVSPRRALGGNPTGSHLCLPLGQEEGFPQGPSRLN